MNNLLKGIYPEIFSQIDIEKTKQEYPNIDLNTLTIGSNKIIWFKCPNGHSYKNAVYKKCKNKDKYSCPICTGHILVPGINDFQTRFPDIAKEWDYERNYPVLSSQVLPGTHKKYWWICPKCGNSYCANINSRTSLPQACPFCRSNRISETKFNTLSNKAVCNHTTLKEKFPDIWAELDFNKNKNEFPNINLDTISYSSHKKLYWKCKNNHSYLSAVNDRTNHNSGCPNCGCYGKSKIELAVYNIFKNNIKTEVISGYKENKYELDIYIQKFKVGVEYDGSYYHSSDISKYRELRKEEYFYNKNIKIIRIKETSDKSLNNTCEYKKETNTKIYYIYFNRCYTKDFYSRLNNLIKRIFKNEFEIIISNIDVRLELNKMRF